MIRDELADVCDPFCLYGCGVGLWTVSCAAVSIPSFAFNEISIEWNTLRDTVHTADVVQDSDSLLLTVVNQKPDGRFCQHKDADDEGDCAQPCHKEHQREPVLANDQEVEADKGERARIKGAEGDRDWRRVFLWNQLCRPNVDH